jgi:hypothetical protein
MLLKSRPSSERQTGRADGGYSDSYTGRQAGRQAGRQGRLQTPRLVVSPRARGMG